MNKPEILLTVCVCIASGGLIAQRGGPRPVTPAAPAGAKQAKQAATSAKPEELVREWFRRWNALDGSESSVEQLIALYEPGGVNQLPPSDRQIGPVYMEGPEGVRKMAADFLKDWTLPSNRIDKVTADGKTTDLLFKSQGPWGGPAIGVQYTQVATDRTTNKQYALPAFAVFHIENDKIRYARFYATRVETHEQ